MTIIYLMHASHTDEIRILVSLMFKSFTSQYITFKCISNEKIELKEIQYNNNYNNITNKK